ncbi:MAG: class I SAM-dependent methyltransferase [Bacteroidota bacterium]
MKKKIAGVLPADNFYDEVSEFYDKMIDFEKNLDLRIHAYQKIFPEKGTAVDFGCGIGLDSIALAMNGHKVTAFDVSSKMIEETKQNAAKFRLNIKAYTQSFESVPKNFNGKFNYVVSVGNTIAHLKANQLKRAIEKIYKMILPGGKIFLHILNYELIKNQKMRINNIANRDGKIIIRFYDFLTDNLDFNILSFHQNSPKDFQLVTTKHYPHKKSEIAFYLNAAGFTGIKFMKNFAGEKFNVRDSKDLFVEATKKL